MYRWNRGVRGFLEEADERRDIFKRLVDTPRFIQLLQPVAGKNFLDIGCGNGDLCQRLSLLGATVTGLDSSPEMIREAAKGHAEGRYVVADLIKDELPFLEEEFDTVTAKMVLMYTSIEDVARKVHRVLTRGGLFAVDIVHPLRTLQKSRSRRHSRFSRKINYFEETEGQIRFGNTTYPYYYRPSESYINGIIHSGFELIELREIGVPQCIVDEYPQERSKLNTPVSMHMLFRRKF